MSCDTPSFGQCAPPACGAWDAPVTLSLGDGDTDIASAALLPTEATQVLFWCRAKYPIATYASSYGTYLWKATNPSNVRRQIVPVRFGGTLGDVILKCSVALLDTNGDVFTMGGDDQNQYSPISEVFVGTNVLYRYNSTGTTTAWTQDMLDPTTPNTLYLPRWYPSAVVMSAGRVLVFGNGGHPAGSSQHYDYRENGAWFNQPLTNRQYRSWMGTPCQPAMSDWLEPSQFPRLRWIGHSGHVAWLDGWIGNLYGQNAGGQMTCYMDVQQSPCPLDDTAPQFRWEIGQPTNQHLDKTPYAHVVHYVMYDEQGGNIKDVVYRVSGADRAFCDSAMVFWPHTWRMTNLPPPGVAAGLMPGTQVDWQQLPTASDVHHPRLFANLVILADGSMMLLGGTIYSGSACVTVLTAERFEPKELFPQSTETWEVLPDQEIDRRNHAVALLLPDGSVWSGGGAGPEPYMQDPPPPPASQAQPDAWHSFEIYKPKYMFQGQRPEISDVGGVWAVGAVPQRTINVNHYNGVSPYGQTQPAITRAALIRYGVTTHHDDQHQRYIELPLVGPPVYLPDNTQDVTVVVPPSELVAPKGYYMLVVIDENGLPSNAWRLLLQ